MLVNIKQHVQKFRRQNKKTFFLHFLKRFKGYEIYVIADNVSDDTYSFLQTHIESVKIIRTNLHNAKSFIFAVDFAISTFEPHEKVYFAEDDYLYTEDSNFCKKITFELKKI